jgi:cold shock CspA family protein
MKQYNGLIKAKVRWFDNLSGEGFIRMPDGQSVFCHKSAFGSIYGKEHVALEDDDVVYVTVYEDFNYMQISTLIAQKEVL